MVRLEVGRAYMTGTKHLVLVSDHDPNLFSYSSIYSKHTYLAILLRTPTLGAFMGTFTEEGIYHPSSPSNSDVIRESTPEELDKYLSENKSQLLEHIIDKYLGSFYKAWKEKNP